MRLGVQSLVYIAGETEAGAMEGFSKRTQLMRVLPSRSSSPTKAGAYFFQLPRPFRKESLCLCASPGERGWGCECVQATARCW